MELKKIGIVLVRPQLPENIGMVARVMQNFGLKKLILVSPKKNWLNKKSINAAKKGSKIIINSKVYFSLNEAIENFNFVIGTTNRQRFLEKKIINNFSSFNKQIKINPKTAILFGPENSGLSNQDLRLVDFLFTINTSSVNNSLNLSHAVSIISSNLYEFFNNKTNTLFLKKNKISNKKELNFFIEHIIKKLDKKRFFYPVAKKESMIDNIYAIFLKATLSKKEINTLWGIVKKLEK